jgi:hypothetical protein
MNASGRSAVHHAALVFAIASLLGSVLSGAGPSPAPAGCMVEVYDCREVDGFCVAQSEQGTIDPNKRLRICDNGLRAAAHGELGHTYPPLPQSRLRECYCFRETRIASCDDPPAGFEKLSSCGTNGHGQCCYGKGRVSCDTLHNSSQSGLSPHACSGFNPANP